ncbi:MAG: AMIN domain-containing protein [Halioglobus sp.]|nr:AMIN domain-containing protein [Halioglobus sp.]
MISEAGRIGVWISVMLGLCLAASARATDVQEVRLWRAPDHTRIVFDLSAPAKHEMLVLSSPERIVIDLEDTRLLADLARLELGNTPVARVRSGIREGDDLRVVFDVENRVEPRSFALKANAQAGDRLVVDLYDKAARTDEVNEVKKVRGSRRDAIS